MRRRHQPAFVLAYHRVTEDPSNGFALSVHPDNFRRHLRQLKAIGEIVPLEEITRESRAPRIALTFDDGYYDNLSVALPLLEEVAAPATIFVTTGNVRSGSPFWWDLLEAILLAAPGDLTWSGAVGGQPVRLTFADNDARKTALHEVHSILLRLDHQGVATELDSLRRALQVPAEVRTVHRPLSVDECRALAASPLIRIGSHTSTHPDLTRLDAATRDAELRESRDWLAQTIDNTVTSFCYPFGRWDQDVADSTGAAGYRMACTLEPGRVDRSTAPMRVPRFMVFDQADRAFSLFLQGCL